MFKYFERKTTIFINKRHPLFFFEIKYPQNPIYKRKKLVDNPVITDKGSATHLSIHYLNKDGEVRESLIYFVETGDCEWKEGRRGVNFFVHKDIAEKYFYNNYFKITWGENFLAEVNTFEFHSIEKEIKYCKQEFDKYSIQHTAERKVIQEKIKMWEEFKGKFIDWFMDVGIPVPTSSIENEGGSLNDDEMPSQIDSIEEPHIDEAKSQDFKLKQNDAFDLLKRLEKKEYILTSDDEMILNHKDFGSYKSKHIKKFVSITFDSVFAELLKQWKMTHDKFFSITKCPKNDYYKRGFLESFFYHCTNPKGRYFEKFSGKELNIEGSIRENGSRKPALVVK